MTAILSTLTKGQAQALINFFIAFVQYTLPLLLVTLMICLMPITTTALSWNSISQTLHSSLWPTLLRTDSDRSTDSGRIVRALSFLFALSAIILPVSKVVLPLGLHDGPLLTSTPVHSGVRYVPDVSALIFATSPERELFTHGYKCVPDDLGCDSNNITTNIPAPLNEIFRSTPHGPFSIQYRQFLNIQGHAASIGYPASAETFLLRNGTFVAEGLVIDMTHSHPGLGFINHTVPDISVGHGREGNSGDYGGTWSQDLLFLEPVTSCVDTNLTVEYVLENGVARIGVMAWIVNSTLIDRGGFVNFPETLPDFFPDDEEFDLQKHAHRGAILATADLMQSFNTSQADSHMNKTYPMSVRGNLTINTLPIFVGRVTPFPLLILGRGDATTALLLASACRGFTGEDLFSLNNIHVNCGMFLGPPVRTDGGEHNVYAPGSRWMQNLHTCASTTRATIQTITFSLGAFNDSTIGRLNATRDLNRPTVLWAVEKRANATIRDSIPLWGRVDDRYSLINSSSLSTVRSDHLLLPANTGSIIDRQLPEGSPQNAHSTIWRWVHGTIALIPEIASSLTDYTGTADYAMKTKYQSIITENGPTVGAETVLNLMWTDMMANQLVGATKSDASDVVLNLHSLNYDFRFATPGFVLGLIWLPIFLSATTFLALRQVTWTYLKDVYNHLSIGRVITGASALRVASESASSPQGAEKAPMEDTTEKESWARSVGQTLITLTFGQKESRTETAAETVRLME